MVTSTPVTDTNLPPNPIQGAGGHIAAHQTLHQAVNDLTRAVDTHTHAMGEITGGQAILDALTAVQAQLAAFTAAQVTVDTATGLVGPTVQTALEDLLAGEGGAQGTFAPVAFA